MKDKIILGETPSRARVELDLQELITGRTLLCSISRFGKTWTARRIVEQVFGKTGIIIVDVEGEYATLRDKYPLLIIGKDVPLIPESAEFLADQVLEHDLSCIIDGSDPQLDVAAFQEFIARFIERFIAIETKARKPFLWILEEADELSPETGIARSICLGQIRKLVKKGGKRGLGTIVLTQRPAFVSKFVISQCLPSGESVITKSGLRPIEEVRVGDLVLTHRGRFRAVTQTFSRPYQGELLRVKTKGWNKATRVTPEHPFLTRALVSTSTERPVLQRLAQLQWLEASKLTKQVYIVFPRLLETKDRELVTIDYSYNNRGGRAPHLCHKTLILPVDENLMRVIGYYIAEGSLRRFRAPTARAIRWTFGKGPMEETYAKQLRIALGKLGFKARLDLVLGCYHVSVASTGLPIGSKRILVLEPPTRRYQFGSNICPFLSCSGCLRHMWMAMGIGSGNDQANGT